jgi:hypothetical protein
MVFALSILTVQDPVPVQLADEDTQPVNVEPKFADAERITSVSLA